MLDVPNDGATDEIALKARIVSGKTSTTSIAICTSYDSIFLPRYSGVRPTISPAMNTDKTTKIRMPYIPAPTPPKITSPSMMLTSGTRPPSGVNESCQLLIAPQLASVVTVANSAEFTSQKRVAARLRPVRRRHTREKQEGHRPPHGPAVLGGPGHLAQRVGEAGRDGEDAHHLD